ncbi:MAG TPA: NPCBM/NEW2 domain-containing protein [Verrucomicrobiae bacterium]|jgi:hypothetical protein
MNSRVLAALVLAAGVLAAGAIPDDPDGRAMMQAAERIIAASHEGQPRATNLLRVVYFVPKDGEPLSNYEARVDRIVTDVSDFYRDGLLRFGIKTPGLPLERKDGKLVVRLVRGKLPASQYHYDSGGQTAAEIRLALSGTLDMERECVLALYGLSRKTNDGRYIFDAPYYGGGSQGGGLCHAADCELLDPLLLRETNQTMVFTEHYYPRFKATVAKFNTMYLGGVAHELGHALGLPHDDGGPDERRLGESLMGGGNLNYREELWGGTQPAYLSRGSALQLLSQPLITQCNQNRWDDTESDFESLRFSAANGAIRIQGRVTGAIQPYAVIASVWPVSERIDDHWARTYPCVLDKGAFTLDLTDISTGKFHNFHLVISRLQVNGAAQREEFPLSYDAAGAPDPAALNGEWMVDRAETAVMRHRQDARKFLAAEAPAPEAARKLHLLREVLDPPAPFDLATVPGGSAFLSDAKWSSAKVGWGKVARNHYWFDDDIQNGVFLLLGGQFFDKGLYAHSNARYVFPLAGKWKTFTAIIGLRDGATSQGSAIFTVRGDGRELFRSGILRPGQRAGVKADITGVRKLELLTEGGEGHNHNSWAIWAEPKVER